MKSDNSYFGKIVVEAFNRAAELADWVAAPVDRKNWYHYMTFDRGIPGGTAALLHSGEYAWFDFAAIHPDYRGKGAQFSFLSQRELV